jgi:hypothetical protein
VLRPYKENAGPGRAAVKDSRGLLVLIYDQRRRQFTG